MLQFKNKKLVLFISAILAIPFFAFAVNDVSVSHNTNFELNTADTAAHSVSIYYRLAEKLLAAPNASSGGRLR